MLDSAQQQWRFAFDAIADDYDDNDFFCSEIRNRLAERFELMNLQPEIIVDLGAATGKSAVILEQYYPSAQLIEVDWSMQMLRQRPEEKRLTICADSHRLPLADSSVDIVFSNLLLPACADPERIFAEAQRVLREPGLLLFSTLGPDTLKEIRKAWQQTDQHEHVQAFADMHNVGDALVKAGFLDPVMDVEMLTINYRDMSELIADLRAVAATNRSPQRSRGLTTPRRWENFVAAMGRDEQRRIPISFEVVCGQAWRGAPAAGVIMEDGEARFPISSLKRNRR